MNMQHGRSQIREVFLKLETDRQTNKTLQGFETYSVSKAKYICDHVIKKENAAVYKSSLFNHHMAPISAIRHIPCLCSVHHP